LNDAKTCACPKASVVTLRFFVGDLAIII